LNKYILTPFSKFLNTDKEIIFEGIRESLQKELGVTSEQSLYQNGYRYKPIKYIDSENCLKIIEVPIKRLLWIIGNNKREHIYVYPSFILKFCPFPINDLERVHTEFLSQNIEPFNVLEDNSGLLDSSIPYESWTKRLESLLRVKDFQAQWSKLYYESFFSLLNVSTNMDFLSQCLDMVRLFLEKLNKKASLKIEKYRLLSYANFQLPFR
jgi:hypothetical protein